jgi:hypothetical protein
MVLHGMKKVPHFSNELNVLLKDFSYFNARKRLLLRVTRANPFIAFFQTY